MSLVSYLDDQFKKTFRTMSDADIEEVVDKVISLFRYLTDKDIFEGFYKSSLAKRLLDNKSSNTDAEKLVIAKLKEECGFMFTTKLEIMFKDMNVS
jgi:cullin 3